MWMVSMEEKTMHMTHARSRRSTLKLRSGCQDSQVSGAGVEVVVEVVVEAELAVVLVYQAKVD